MRSVALLNIVISLSWTIRAQQPYLDASSPKDSLNPLVKRQGCASGYTACSALGASGQCCPNNTVCARDQNGNVACCPTNAVCTGVISGSASRTSTSAPILGGSTTASTAVLSQTTSYSTLANAPYPFIQIPQSYVNQQQCLNAYSACQSVSAACFNSLAGANGVTVSGIGTLGITQVGATATVAIPSASSVCSSLYGAGCYNIAPTACEQFGTAGSTQTTGFVQANAGAVGPAGCNGALYTAAAAVFAGAGMANLVMR